MTSVNETLFKKCLEMLAKNVGGQVSTTFSDYYGKEMSSWNGNKIIAAIKTPQVPRGIGMIVRDGKLEFVGDNYGVTTAYSKLKFQIESIYETTYRQLGLIQSLSEMGYEVDVQKLSLGHLIKGIKSE